MTDIDKLLIMHKGVPFGLDGNGSSLSNVVRWEGKQPLPSKTELDQWWADNQSTIEAEELKKRKTRSLKKDFLDDNAEDFIRLIMRALKEINQSDNTIFTATTKQKSLALIQKFQEYKNL